MELHKNTLKCAVKGGCAGLMQGPKLLQEIYIRQSFYSVRTVVVLITERVNSPFNSFHAVQNEQVIFKATQPIQQARDIYFVSLTLITIKTSRVH